VLEDAKLRHGIFTEFSSVVSRARRRRTRRHRDLGEIMEYGPRQRANEHGRPEDPRTARQLEPPDALAVVASK